MHNKLVEGIKGGPYRIRFVDFAIGEPRAFKILLARRLSFSVNRVTNGIEQIGPRTTRVPPPSPFMIT